MDINYALKLFKESGSDAAVMLRKAEQAKCISAQLNKLKKQAAKISTKIECEIAVVQAQDIINL
jgi:hypothetical protein